MNIKEQLDNIYYNKGNQSTDFWVTGLVKSQEIIIRRKWKRYSEVVMPLNPEESYKLKWINQRQVLNNEIVLDIEDKKDLDLVLIKLKELNNVICPKEIKIYDTHSRGYHVHLFFRNNISEENKIKFIKYLGTDLSKAYTKTLIALEGVKHWKSGKVKEEVFL